MQRPTFRQAPFFRGFFVLAYTFRPFSDRFGVKFSLRGVALGLQFVGSHWDYTSSPPPKTEVFDGGEPLCMKRYREARPCLFQDELTD